MKPEEIDELIAMVKAGQDVRLRLPGGPVIQLTEHHLDDLHLAKAASAFIEEASERLLSTEPDWLRPTHNRCRWCGSAVDVQWTDVGTYADPHARIPGWITCRNPECVPRCPICHREVGDIHGAECGPIILAKVGDLTPCTITRQDCGERLLVEAMRP